MKGFGHVIFDLDGTLTDPGVGITRSVQYALEKYGINAETESLYKFIGPPLRDSFCLYFGFSRDRAEEAVSFYREYFSQTGIFENEVYPGIPELLSLLRESNKKLYLATTKPAVYAEQILCHFRLDSYFTSVKGSNLDGTNGDKTGLIASVIRENSIIEPASAVMVGDRRFDIEGAKANGILSVGVVYGYGERGELEEAVPDFLAESVADLERILLKS